MTAMTAAQRKAQTRAEYEEVLADCPNQKLLGLLTDKWVSLILAALGSGGLYQRGAHCATDPRPMRHSELSRALAGVSQKMLTQTLRSLERDGLVSRIVVPTVPVTVSYELTPLGLSLVQMIRGLKLWAETHMPDILTHRAAYDARVP